jgi:CTP:molybdopterin cytidylyltransferase MocA
MSDGARTGPVAAVVLAAGEASRFGSPKQNLLLPAVLASAARVGFSELIVVEGAHPIDVELGGGARLVPCANWAAGPGASLGCGLGALAPDTEAAVIVLADGPRLDPRAIERVIAEWRATCTWVLAASYDGERSHPVLIDRAAWSRVPPAGARALDARLVDCGDLTHPGDVDTPGDLARLEADPAP